MARARIQPRQTVPLTSDLAALASSVVDALPGGATPTVCLEHRPHRTTSILSLPSPTAHHGPHYALSQRRHSLSHRRITRGQRKRRRQRVHPSRLAAQLGRASAELAAARQPESELAARSRAELAAQSRAELAAGVGEPEHTAGELAAPAVEFAAGSAI